jgi:hypothetical protein
MTASLPGHNVIESPELARRDAPALARFANPYALYGNGEIVRFVREGATVTGLEFTFGEGEEPIRAQKIR